MDELVHNFEPKITTSIVERELEEMEAQTEPLRDNGSVGAASGPLLHPAVESGLKFSGWRQCVLLDRFTAAVAMAEGRAKMRRN